MKVGLYEKYKKEIVPALRGEFGYKSVMQAPKISKVVINVGVGKFMKEPNYIENVENTISRITGQKPIRTKAKKAISNFKIRAGMDVGVKVTLRGSRMYHFLEKLLYVTLPRVRDFRGVSDKSFDQEGRNYTLGLKENLAFPEVMAEDASKIHGLEITIQTTAKNRQESKALLSYLGFPFVK